MIVDPTTGTAVCGVSGMVLAGICPAAITKLIKNNDTNLRTIKILLVDNQY